MEMDYSFIISREELNENGPDNGVIFCENCRREHIIQYFDAEPHGFLIRVYQCEDELIFHFPKQNAALVITIFPLH